MHRERVSENVYWFQSEVYAQVTAGIVAGPQWAVAIDTLALPDETLSIREFIEHELNVPVRYVINTHYHADHRSLNGLFKKVIFASHEKDAPAIRDHKTYEEFADTDDHSFYTQWRHDFLSSIRSLTVLSPSSTKGTN